MRTDVAGDSPISGEFPLERAWRPRTAFAARNSGGIMNRRTALTIFILTAACAYAQTAAPRQPDGSGRPPQTMKTLARGADFAVASIMPQATLTGERVLRAGGNAFDAVVAGQAVLGLVQPSANGIG